MTALFQNGLDEKEIRQTKRKGVKTSSSKILNAEEDITATVNHHHSKNRDNEEDLSITHKPNKLKPKQKNNREKENLSPSIRTNKVLNYEESEKAFNQNSNETSELTKNHYNAYEDDIQKLSIMKMIVAVLLIKVSQKLILWKVMMKTIAVNMMTIF